MTDNLARFDQSKQQLAGLNERRTRLQVQLETAQTQLREAQKEAEAKYGTSDLAALKELLARQERENQEALDLFQTAVTQFGRTLSRIEGDLANPAALAALLTEAPPVIPAAPVAPAVSAEPLTAAAQGHAELDI